MLRTNLQHKNRFRNPNFTDGRFVRASEILEKLTAPKPKITVMHAALYADNVRVDYFADSVQKHGKIMLPNLERFVLLNYRSKDLSDVNIYYFIDENLFEVCRAYITAGKELANA